MLTVRISTPGSLAASSLKRLVCASQTGVSSDGTTLKIRTWWPVASSVTGFRLSSTTSKSGPLSPAFSSGPSSVMGLPLKVVAPALSFTSPVLFIDVILAGCPQRGALDSLHFGCYSLVAQTIVLCGLPVQVCSMVERLGEGRRLTG